MVDSTLPATAQQSLEFCGTVTQQFSVGRRSLMPAVAGWLAGYNYSTSSHCHVICEERSLQAGTHSLLSFIP